MDFAAIYRLIVQGFSLFGIIRDALRTGESVLKLLEEKGPALLQFFIEAAKQLFPGLTSKEDLAAAGALIQTDHETVRWIQSTLIKLGHPCGSIDGIYGKMTKAAVEKFQTASEFKTENIDGWAGPQTQAVMQVKLAALDATPDMVKAMATAAVQP